MTKPVQPNLIKASNLILIAQVLGIINGLLFAPLDSSRAIVTAIVMVTVLVGLALLIRRGSQTAKWVFSILTFLGVFPMFLQLITIFSQNVVSGTLEVVGSVLQILAVMLMFIPSKQAAASETSI